MSKRSPKQVSIRGVSYEKVKEYCTEHDISIATFIDKLCADFFAPVSVKRYNGARIDFRTVSF